MALTIQIGNCTENPRKLDKMPNFLASNPVEITVDIKNSCSIMRPEFVLVSTAVDISHYNYLIVPSWNGRCYYIDDIVTMPGVRTAIRCREDVLTSNAAQIGDLLINVHRAEDAAIRNRYIHDSGYNVQANRQCETIPLNRTPFSANYSTDEVYILTVVGGTDTSQ